MEMDQNQDDREVKSLSEHKLDEVDHDEKPNDLTEVTSAFANLTRAQCIRKFWRLYLSVLSVSMGAMYAGYGHSVIGSIIANEGFIKQFATVSDPETGEPALASYHVSLWQAITFISQIFIQLFAHLTADRYGRKFNMWGFTVLLTGVGNVFITTKYPPFLL